MIDPLNIDEKTVSLLVKERNLQILKFGKEPYYFIKNGLLKYGLNINDSFFDNMKKSNFQKEATIVTGFGLTGGLHLGSKLLLNELGSFYKLNCNVVIFLSTEDGLSKKFDIDQIKIFKNIIISFIHKKFGKSNLVQIIDDANLLFDEQDLENIMKRDDIYVDIFHEIPSFDIKKALAAMALSIASLESQIKGDKYILLGIDEVYNALFITKVFELLNIPKPSFLFNQVILGYDLKKMGKSRPNTSLLIDSEFNQEFVKLNKSIIDKTEEETRIIFNEIALFSEFGSNYLEKLNNLKIEDMKNIIKQEIMEFKIMEK